MPDFLHFRYKGGKDIEKSLIRFSSSVIEKEDLHDYEILKSLCLSR
jgi:hypothetical protein